MRFPSPVPGAFSSKSLPVASKYFLCSAVSIILPHNITELR